MHRVVLAITFVSGCEIQDAFVCDRDEQCRRDGLMGGKCEASNNCSFTDVTCPTGQRYDVLADRSSECVVDDDGDMVADDGDNCVGLVNPQQDDEDMDGRGDPCDPCPPFSDNAAGAGDDDGDGVSNLCDPSPTTKNKIVFFDGFHAPLSTGWSVTGSAIIENDGLTLQNKVEVKLPAMSGSPDLLMVSVTLQDEPALGAWLGLGYIPAGGGAYCELTTKELQLWANTSPILQLDKADFAASRGTPYIYAMKRPGAMQYACSAATGAGVPATEIMGMTSNGTMDVHFGADVTTKFQWVLVVGPM